MMDMLRQHHRYAAGYTALGTPPPRTPTVSELVHAIKQRPDVKYEIQGIYDRQDLDDDAKLSLIQHIVLREAPEGEGDRMPDLLTACDELEQLLEVKGEDIMKRLCGMEPKAIGNFTVFINRLIEAIQMTNDERVQTKENYSRTCTLNVRSHLHFAPPAPTTLLASGPAPGMAQMVLICGQLTAHSRCVCVCTFGNRALSRLQTEYVGTMSFQLEEEDNEFLWRKGYLSTKYWLEKRSEKTKKKKKKVCGELAKELKAQAKERKSIMIAQGLEPIPNETPTDNAKPPAEVHDSSPLGAFTKKLSHTLANSVMNDADKLIVIDRLLKAQMKVSTVTADANASTASP